MPGAPRDMRCPAVSFEEWRILAVVATRACSEPNRSSAWSVAGRVGGGRWYGPACPRVKGAARPCGTGLRPALDPRDPPALGQGSCGQGDGPARLTRPPPYVASAGRVCSMISAEELGS